MSRSVGRGYCLWTVRPKEGRERTVAVWTPLLWSLSSSTLHCEPAAVMWELNGGDHCLALGWLCFIGIPLPYHISRSHPTREPSLDLVSAVPSEGHWSLPYRPPKPHGEHDRNVTCEWEIEGELSSVTQHRLPKHCPAWSGEGLWLRRCRVGCGSTDALLFALFLALPAPCISGPSLRIWLCAGNSIILGWMENLPRGHIPWARHPTDCHVSALQDLGSFLQIGGRY